MKIAIIYRGNIRGFKYENCFDTHKKLYDNLNKNNIEFDVFLCTNNFEFDSKNIDEIPNLKIKDILILNSIRETNEYKKSIKNIKFTTPGWNSIYQNNIITYWYNNNKLFYKIKDKYDKYLLLDIGQIIEKYNLNLFLDDKNYVSSFESNKGFNTRIMITNYNLFKKIMCQFEYILNNENQIFYNPEQFNSFFLKDYNIIKTNELYVKRIRENGSIL